MTDIEHVRVDRPLGPLSHKGLGWWGIVMTIATEGTLFALLLFSYFYTWANSPEWPQGGIEAPKMFVTSIRTALLILSSIPAQLAERAIKQERSRAFIGWLALTFAMASVFLAFHVIDVLDDWEKWRPSTNAYGSLFFTITNLHALHLVIGMSFLVYIAVRGVQGRYGAKGHDEVSVVVLYWHFVDAVWIFVFSSLYIAVQFA
jgi:cytochrome c oxidase subunit 3